MRSAAFLIAGSVLSAITLTGCRAALTPSLAPLAASPQREARSKSLPSMILVGNYSGNAILGFPLSAKGDVASLGVIAGSKTKLDSPTDLVIRD